MRHTQNGEGKQKKKQIIKLLLVAEGAVRSVGDGRGAQRLQLSHHLFPAIHSRNSKYTYEKEHKMNYTCDPLQSNTWVRLGGKSHQRHQLRRVCNQE